MSSNLSEAGAPSAQLPQAPADGVHGSDAAGASRPATGGGAGGAPRLSRADSHKAAAAPATTTTATATAATDAGAATAGAAPPSSPMDGSDAALAAELNKALAQARAEGCSPADLQYIEVQFMHNRYARARAARPPGRPPTARRQSAHPAELAAPFVHSFLTPDRKLPLCSAG